MITGLKAIEELWVRRALSDCVASLGKVAQEVRLELKGALDHPARTAALVFLEI